MKTFSICMIIMVLIGTGMMYAPQVMIETDPGKMKSTAHMGWVVFEVAGFLLVAAWVGYWWVWAMSDDDEKPKKKWHK